MIDDFKLQQVQPQIQQYLQQGGIEGTTARQGSLEMVYRLLQRQAAMLSFNDVFWLLSVFFICLVPFVMIIRRRRDQIAGAGCNITRLLNLN